MSQSERENNGSNSTTKVVLIILGVGGVLLLVCCGGGIYLFRKAAETVKQMATDDPNKVREMTASIVDITVPDVYSPKGGVNIAFIGMQMCFYTRADESGGVFIMEMSGPAAANKAQTKQQFQQQLRQQGQNKDVSIESTETRTFTINGEECEFEFIKGKNTQNNQDMRQVMGVIPGKTGTAFLMVFETEENWDEAAIVMMIESMGGTEVTSSVAPVMEEAPVEPAPEDAPGDAASAAPAADSTPTPQ